MDRKKVSSSTRAFTFIEILVVLLIVSLWYSGSLIELEQYLWVFEIIASMFWFAFLFVFLKRVIFDFTKRRTLFWNIKPLIVFLFFLHIAVAVFLRFGLQQSIFTAYPFSFALCLVLPLILLPLYVKGRDQYGNIARLSPERIRDIALQSPAASDFLQRYPDCAIYVYNYTHKDLVGTCLLQHRCARPERPNLFEDILLEVLIDFPNRAPFAGKERFIHYLFQPYQDRSIVMELPEQDFREIVTLDEMTLARFDQIINAFPSLDRYPLPIAIRKIPFEIVPSTL